MELKLNQYQFGDFKLCPPDDIYASSVYASDIMDIFKHYLTVNYLRTEKITSIFLATQYINKLIEHNQNPYSHRSDFFIMNINSHRVLGHIGIAKMDFEVPNNQGDDNNPKLRFFIILNNLVWGLGFGRKISEGFLYNLPENIKEIYTHCPPDNLRGVNLINSLGFKYLYSQKNGYGEKMQNQDVMVYKKTLKHANSQF